MPRALITVQKFAHALSVYAVADGRELARVPLPDYPHEFALDEQRGMAYVGHYGIPTQFDEGQSGHAVLAVDFRAGKLVQRLECGPQYSRIHGIAVDAVGRVYALSETARALLVFETPLTLPHAQRVLPSAGDRSHIVVVTSDGSRAYCANLLSDSVSVIHPFDADTPTDTLVTGSRPEGLALSADESVLFVTHRGSNTLAAVDTKTWTIRGQVATGIDPTRVVVTANGQLLVTHYGEHSVGVYGSDLQPHCLVPVQANPIAIGYDARDGLVYATLKNDSVAVIDPESWSVRRTFPVGAEPDGVALVDWT